MTASLRCFSFVTSLFLRLTVMRAQDQKSGLSHYPVRKEKCNQHTSKNAELPECRQSAANVSNAQELPGTGLADGVRWWWSGPPASTLNLLHLREQKSRTQRANGKVSMKAHTKKAHDVEIPGLKEHARKPIPILRPRLTTT